MFKKTVTKFVYDDEHWDTNNIFQQQNYREWKVNILLQLHYFQIKKL